MNEITKSLATMEDLAQGVGQTSQNRGDQDLVLGKVAVPYGVANEAELKALDVTKFTLAKIFGPNGTIEYQYDELDDSGLLPTVGDGSWLELKTVKDIAQDLAIASLLNLTTGGATGQFTSADGKVIGVANGLVTSIVPL
jgi:hypothetical protein